MINIYYRRDWKQRRATSKHLKSRLGVNRLSKKGDEVYKVSEI